MRTVWKFPLPYTSRDQMKVVVPRGARPLRADFDPTGELVVWCEVDPDAERVAAVVTVVGTGYPIPEDAGEYLSTVLSPPFVWHVYWRAE